MASELKVDKFTGISTADVISVTTGSATTTLQAGMIKQRAHHLAGTLSSGSLNCSSITDNGTGDYTHNFSNNFSDALYGHFGAATYGIGSTVIIHNYMRADNDDSSTSMTLTSSIRCESVYVWTSANRTNYDYSSVDLICAGDLA